MNCRKCGHALESGSNFCSECGEHATQGLDNHSENTATVPAQVKPKQPLILALIASGVVLLLGLGVFILLTGGGSGGSRGPEQAALQFLESYQKQDQDSLQNVMHPLMIRRVQERQSVMLMHENYFHNFPQLEDYQIAETEILEGYEFEDMLDHVEWMSEGYNESSQPLTIESIAFVYADVTMNTNGVEHEDTIEITVVEDGGRWYFFDFY